MGEVTKIEWTDHTFNPWIGCSRVHTGCLNCYAEELMDHRYGKAKWGASGTRVRTSPDNWRKPIAWNAAAERDGVRRRVFCASLADVFEDWGGKVLSHRFITDPACPENGFQESKFQPALWWRRDRGVVEHGGVTVNRSQKERIATLADVRADLFRLIDATPHLDWLLLTKRPDNVIRMWPACRMDTDGDGNCPTCANGGLLCKRRPNVWIGTSVSNQETADTMIPELVKCRELSPVLFLSAEPLLGPVELRMNLPGERMLRWHRPVIGMVDWIIVGGESGHGARPCDISWIGSIVAQCAGAGTACFVKQLGARPLAPSGPLRFEDQKGGDWNTWPADLRVRQFPEFADAAVC